MWIKEPNKNFCNTISARDDVEFLFKSGSTYIMDNHLCAGWAWAKELDLSKSYNFFHVDRHYDLGRANLDDSNINLSELSFGEFTEIRTKGGGKSFNWGNYIYNIHSIYPRLIQKSRFACHDTMGGIDGIENRETCFYELNNIAHWVNESSDQWIFNLDLDFFFRNMEDEIIQVFTDDYIRSIALSLKDGLRNIAVLTICLSPLCCGGWEKVIRINGIFCEILEIEFNLDDYLFTK